MPGGRSDARDAASDRMFLRVWGIPPLPPGARLLPPVGAQLDSWLTGSELLVVDAPAGFGKTTQLSAWLHSPTMTDYVVWISGSMFFTQWENAWKALAQGLADLGVAADIGAGGSLPDLYVALQRLTHRVVLVIDEADRLHPLADLDQLEREVSRFPHLRAIVVTSTPLKSDPAQASPRRVTVGRNELRWTEQDARDAYLGQGAVSDRVTLGDVISASGGRPSTIIRYLQSPSYATPLQTPEELRAAWALERVSRGSDPGRAQHILLTLAQFIEFPRELLAQFDINVDERSFSELVREGLVAPVSAPGTQSAVAYRVSREDRVALEPVVARHPIDAQLHEKAVAHFGATQKTAMGLYHLSRLGRFAEALDLFRSPLSRYDSTVALEDLREAIGSVPDTVLADDTQALAHRLLLAQLPPLEPARSRATLESALLSTRRKTMDALPLASRTIAMAAAVGSLVARGRPAEAAATGHAVATELLALPWSELHQLGRAPGLLWTAQAEAEMLEGRISSATEFAEAALRSSEDGAHLYGLFLIEANMAAIAAIEGAHERVAGHAERAEQYYAQGGWPPSSKLYPLAIARFFVAVSDLDGKALAQVADQFDIAGDRADPWWAAGEVARGYAMLLDGHPTQALARVSTVLRIASSSSASRLLRSVIAAAHADILNVLGRPGAAIATLEVVPDTHEHAVCLGARRALSKIQLGDYRGALTATEGCIALGSRHTRRTLVSAQLRRAIAQDQLGSTAAADSSLADALHHLLVTPMSAPFFGLDPERLAPLWDRLEHRDPALHAAGSELIQPWLRFSAQLPRAQATTALSGRELDILAQLRAGATAAEMSEALFLSANTIKSHTRTLYRKLGATSRREAIDAADALGLGLTGR